MSLFGYVEGFYNLMRHHSHLGNIAPEVFEANKCEILVCFLGTGHPATLGWPDVFRCIADEVYRTRRCVDTYK